MVINRTEASVQITINSHNGFLIADEIGDIMPGSEQGFYHHDVRFLSEYLLELNGRRMRPLATRVLEHFHSVHLLSNPVGDELETESLTLLRQRLIDNVLHEDLELQSYVDRPVLLQLQFTFAADFRHIFQVRGHLEPQEGAGLVRSAPARPLADGWGICLSTPDGREFPCVEIRFSQPPQYPRPNVVRFVITLPPRGSWRLCTDVLPRASRDVAPRVHFSCERPRTTLPPRTQRADSAPLREAPRLDTDSYVLQEAYERAVRDLWSLHFGGGAPQLEGAVLAAGIPWFMALFGRDSLTAAYQALPYYPYVAAGVLRALARLQGTRVNPRTEEEPGKILHEHRPEALGGSNSPIPAFPYYGTIDATPLFLIVLAATYRHTGDAALVEELWPAAERALAWIDQYGDRDGDGFLEYQRSTDEGLINQGWKDSWDSIRFRDGRLAQAPIALCEVQGYAYAARLAMAALCEARGDAARAAQLRQAAAELAARFDRAFWLPDRGYYALALDGHKQPVDGLASNAGQALWTGIVPAARAPRVAEVLLGPELFSGWGVRTMGAREGGYNPVGYHTGSVWPHDNSLIAAGLARYGLFEEAGRIIEAQLAAAAHFPSYRLPELFAGYGRDEFSFVVEYPVACSPQAWAAGAMLLYVTTMLGLEVDAPRRTIRLRPFLPPHINHLRLRGVRLPEGELDVELVREYGELQSRLNDAPRGWRVEGAMWRDTPFW
jgi:glycogen debranching enzyme